MSTTQNVPGAVGISPGDSRQRTGADLAADIASGVILAGLVTFAVAVSFAHVMAFIRAHGQNVGWVVVGTASTVVGLTVLGGIEVWRDSRAGRGRGAPALLLAVGIAVELGANMATAPGGWLNRGVAGWPVGVAGAGVFLVTRRLQHAAEAAEREQLQHGQDQAADVDQWFRQLQGWPQDFGPRPDPDPDPAAALPPADVDQAPAEAEPTSKKERILALLEHAETVPGASEVATLVGCTKQHAAAVIKQWEESRKDPRQVPGGRQLDIADMATAAA